VKLSVIIPCYNAAATIDELLSAFAQESWAEPWELLVSNNGCTDATTDVVARFRDALPNLRVVDASDRRGRSHARNVGAREANGELLAFVDADDVIGEGWVAAIGNALLRHDFVASRFDCDRLNWNLGHWRRCPQSQGLQEYKYPRFLPHSGGSGLGVKRAIHERIGGFDEDWPRLQDTDYCWRAQLAGIDLQFIPEAVVHVRLRESPVANCRQAYEWGQYNVLLYKKYRAHGMPKLSVRQGMGHWVALATRLPQLRKARGRARWLREASWKLGRVKGCIKYRTLAF